MNKNKPLIIAHRGASAAAPENTRPAFELACSQGAAMIEIDVRCSADGVLVVFHDDAIRLRDGCERPVSSCRLTDLQAVDISGERVPTLAEVCDLARRRGVRLNLDIKQRGIMAEVVAMLRDYDLSHEVIISAFDAAPLYAVQHIAPEIARGYLMGTRSYHPLTRAREVWPFLHLRRVGAVAWHPSHELPLLRYLLPLVRRAGYAVNVWTVDDPQRMHKLVALGATGIITNNPVLARQTFT
jgi:glycerophosphoryl diester phosphodiesterase